MVSKEGLEKFKKIYLKRYGVQLSEQEAFETANNFLNFYRAVFREPKNIKINIKNEQKIRTKKS